MQCGMERAGALDKQGDGAGRESGAQPRDSDCDGPVAAQTRMLVVRHGETTWNQVKRLQGQTDTVLSALVAGAG